MHQVFHRFTLVPTQITVCFVSAQVHHQTNIDVEGQNVLAELCDKASLLFATSILDSGLVNAYFHRHQLSTKYLYVVKKVLCNLEFGSSFIFLVICFNRGMDLSLFNDSNAFELS